MYESHFGLRFAPFQVTPDPSLLFLTEAHQEALAAIMYGIMSRRGFVAVTGEVGVGKTTVLRHALDRLPARKTEIVHLIQPPSGPGDLLRTLRRELAAEGASFDENEEMDAVVADIHGRLLQRFEEGATVVVAVDEAQALSPEALEALRLLSNFEARDSKLLQIVLVGQPELDELLARRELRQVNQRIAIRARLRPLTFAESKRYVAYRLGMASENPGASPFTRLALRQLLKDAKGYPRRLNILCDNALMNAYGHGSRKVTWRIAREAARAQSADRPRPLRWRQVAAAGAALALLVPVAGLAVVPEWRESALDGIETARAMIAAQALRDAETMDRGRPVAPEASVAAASPAPLADPQPVGRAAPASPSAAPASKAPTVARSPEAAETAPPQAAGMPPQAGAGPASVRPEPGGPVARKPDAERADTERTDAERADTERADTERADTDPAPAPAPAPEDMASIAPAAPPPTPKPQPVAVAAAPPPAAKPEKPIALVRVVGRGDTVGRMCVRVYGECGPGHLKRIREANPSIRDLSRIDVGQLIVFPESERTTASR